MAENSKIEWTDHTFNPWRGCTKVSEGCALCYAWRMSKRNPGTLGIWGDTGTRIVASPDYWKQPLKWNAAAQAAGVRQRVFCASLADVFEHWDKPLHFADGSRVWNRYDIGLCTELEAFAAGRSFCNEATLTDVRRKLFRLIEATPWLDWILVTKRPENIRAMWPTDRSGFNKKYVQNIWLLTSVENQRTADTRIRELLKSRDLAPVLGLSCEPLLKHVDLRSEVGAYELCNNSPLRSNALRFLNWVIAGGESGPGARPMHPDWARSLRDQCQTSCTPFFFKQWGEWCPATADYFVSGSVMPDTGEKYTWIGFDGKTQNPSWHGLTQPIMAIAKQGKKIAGRLLDGREWNEMPKGTEVLA